MFAQLYFCLIKLISVMFRNVMYTELFFIWIYKAGACKHAYRCINPLWVKKRLPLYHQYTFAWNCSFSSAYVASHQPLSFKMSDVWFVDTENGCQCEFSLNRWRERLMKVCVLLFTLPIVSALLPLLSSAPCGISSHCPAPLPVVEFLRSHSLRTEEPPRRVYPNKATFDSAAMIKLCFRCAVLISFLMRRF